MTHLPYDCWCNYVTDTELIWRQVDWDSRVIVRGIKDEPFNGYLDIAIKGVRNRFTTENIGQLIDRLLPAIGKKLREDIDSPIAIVPIPNSGMALAAPGPFRVLALAEKVAQGFGEGATVCPALRWDAPRQKAHQTREYRHPGLYEPHLRLVEQPAAPVVVFDDVLTSGSQMIAAARFLTKQGFAPERGLVVAHATKIQDQFALLSKRSDVLDLSEEPFDFDAL